jgi:hypothetical protein
MNSTAYKTRISSPFQVARKPQFSPVERKDTVHEEMKKLLGTYNFSATFEIDNQTATTLKDIPGRVIAFICTLKIGDKIVGQGRGTTAINQINKFIVKNICFAFNGSLVDAIVRSTKIQDMFRPDAIPHPWTNASPVPTSTYKVPDDEESDIATPKQVDYLRQLIQINVGDEDEREGMESQLSELTKSEASDMIKSFQR